MRTAFTIVELIVVIGIVLVLAALLIPAVSMLRETARATDTAQRLDQVVNGLAHIGAERIHAEAVAPHLKSRGFPTGVLRFVVSHETNIRYAVWNNARPAAASIDGNYTSAAAPHCLPFPWGLEALDDTTGKPTGNRHAFAMPGMAPDATVPLLSLSGVEVDLPRWTMDRGRNRPFNDAWGNPLVLAYAFYQPRRNTTVVTRTMQAGGGSYTAIDDVRNTIYEDLFITHAEKAYQYSKAVYLVAAAAGPVLAQPLRGSVAPADVAADQQALWDQATTACEAARWDAAAWSKPPWNGVKQGRATVGGVRVRSLITAPMMVK